MFSLNYSIHPLPVFLVVVFCLFVCLFCYGFFMSAIKIGIIDILGPVYIRHVLVPVQIIHVLGPVHHGIT